MLRLPILKARIPCCVVSSETLFHWLKTIRLLVHPLSLLWTSPINFGLNCELIEVLSLLCVFVSFREKKEGMAQPADVAPYRLVEIEGKGRGLVAAKDLEVGDLVFEEKAFQALFWLSFLGLPVRVVRWISELKDVLSPQLSPQMSSALKTILNVRSKVIYHDITGLLYLFVINEDA